MPNLQSFLKEKVQEFDYEFVRDDGLMDKYYCDGTVQYYMANAIKSFMLSAIKQAYQFGLKEGKK